MSYSKVLLIMATVSVAWGNCVVKSLDAYTTISINDRNRSLAIGKELKLEGNNNVCVSSGKVNIACSNKKYDSNLTAASTNRCKRVNADKSYFAYIKKTIKYFIHKHEIQVDSSSTKGESNNSIKETIELSKNLTSFVIEDDIWAPTPIKLTIYDSNDKNKTEYTSKSSQLTRFEIPVSSLNSGDRLIITNKHDQKLAEFIIDIKD